MNLQYRQAIIQDKRKQTPWRDFVIEICSWYSFMFYKNAGENSTIPVSSRVSSKNHSVYDMTRDQYAETSFEENTFFGNFSKLLFEVGLPKTFHFTENENCEYANCVLGSKNVYLSFTIIKDVENVLYGFSIKSGSKNSMNSFMVRDNSDHVFNSKCVISSYHIFYSRYIKNSNNSWFSSNLIGCSECINCNGLVNQSYCIDNIVYDKAQYFAQKMKILSDKSGFAEKYYQTILPGNNYGSNNIQNCNYVVESDDVVNGQYVFEIEYARNAILIGGNGTGEYVYDCFLNTPAIQHIYGGLSLGTGTEHIYCSMHITGGMNLYYCIYCQQCSFCLGCIGLKNKSYCILNKQYSKEERYAKVDEIFAQMEQDGTLGHFFPATMNPFYFNDTAAYLIDPTFTKEEVTAKGYLWRDEPVKVDIPADAKIVLSKDLGQFEGRKEIETKGTKGENGTKPTFVSFDSSGYLGNPDRYVWHIDPEILKYVIQDEQGNYYRIIPMEYKFLMKHELPLPRKHWLERMKENFRIS